MLILKTIPVHEKCQNLKIKKECILTITHLSRRYITAHWSRIYTNDGHHDGRHNGLHDGFMVVMAMMIITTLFLSLRILFF